MTFHLKNMARVARRHGDKQTAAALERAAMICESYRLELVDAWRAV
jgi:hypothetical protein